MGVGPDARESHRGCQGWVRQLWDHWGRQAGERLEREMMGHEKSLGRGCGVVWCGDWQAQETHGNTRKVESTEACIQSDSTEVEREKERERASDQHSAAENSSHSRDPVTRLGRSTAPGRAEEKHRKEC